MLVSWDRDDVGLWMAQEKSIVFRWLLKNDTMLDEMAEIHYFRTPRPTQLIYLATTPLLIFALLVILRMVHPVAPLVYIAFLVFFFSQLDFYVGELSASHCLFDVGANPVLC